MLSSIVFLVSCANLGNDTNGTATDVNTTNGDTTTQGETNMEETTRGSAAMEESMMREATTTNGATAEGTAIEKTTEGTNTTREVTTKGGTTKGGTTTAGGTAATGEAVTDVRAIISETDKQFLVGRPVRLAGVNVRSVVNEWSFLLGPSDTRQLFAVLEGEQAQEALEVKQGQILSVNGVVRQLPNTEDAQQRFGLSETEAALLQSQEIYLSVDRVEVMER
ncbi:MAG TPA: hypothetical protein VK357_11565 [Rubrobacteraceae bacterium]|nr:hypothetical protein [Rubrobacteraceae bacterium]